MLTAILAKFPLLEVAIRTLLAHAPFLLPLAKTVNSGRANEDESPRALDFDAVVAAITASGVGEGDILIVHSSMKALRGAGLPPEQIVRSLKGIVGDRGTLVLPAFPVIEGEPQGKGRHDDRCYERVFSYDVASPAVWTGMLAKTLMKMDGAIRSRHPGNSVVALGPHASEMMKDNLSGIEPMPCGPGSAWAYCYRNGAKIVMLGVDLVHSLTMIHVAEEAFEDSWPIKGWWRRRSFRVTDGDFEQVIMTRERKAHWARHYAERAFSRDLYRDGVARDVQVGDLTIRYCAANELVDYLRAAPDIAYPYKFFPGQIRRHLKG